MEVLSTVAAAGPRRTVIEDLRNRVENYLRSTGKRTKSKAFSRFSDAFRRSEAGFEALNDRLSHTLTRLQLLERQMLKRVVDQIYSAESSAIPVS